MPTENKLPSLATGHDLNQWKLVPVEPTETMVIDGFESEPDECFTDEEVLEQYRAMSGCQQAAFRAKLCWAAMLAAAPVPTQAELDRAVAERGANPEPDPVLCKFYDVSDWPGLVRELVGHVAQLQDLAKRNVKPGKDTSPPTLLPAYIERVNGKNVAAQPDRPPEAYAIEHAEYMAKSADDVLAKFQAYGLALLAVDEGGDDGEGELLENIDSARGDMQEALVDLRSMVYEFRKRSAKSR